MHIFILQMYTTTILRLRLRNSLLDCMLTKHSEKPITCSNLRFLRNAQSKIAQNTTADYITTSMTEAYRLYHICNHRVSEI